MCVRLGVICLYVRAVLILLALSGSKHPGSLVVIIQIREHLRCDSTESFVFVFLFSLFIKAI